jgi:lipoate---protein ligase
MKYIDLTLPSPAENLAGDEALLDLCEGGAEDAVLRFWESREPFVVVGYANSAAKEVKLDVCAAENIPVLRRLSGGGTVLQGPGCLNYSVILRIAESGPLASITGTNKFVLGKQKAAIESLTGETVRIEGDTDLAIDNANAEGGLKFSGNAQRRKRKFLIFHGTILLKFDISLIEKYLRMPSKEPAYRQGRGHGSFLANLNLEAGAVKQAIQKEWKAHEEIASVPREKIKELSLKKYSTEEWNFKS